MRYINLLTYVLESSDDVYSYRSSVTSNALLLVTELLVTLVGN